MAQENQSFLLFLADAAYSQVKKIIQWLSPSQKRALKEVSLNILKNSLDLAPEVIKHLSKYKKILREIAYKGINKCKGNQSKLCKTIQVMLKAVRHILKSL